MSESFESILAVGGKMNTLGRAAEVVQTVLKDQSRLDELFECIFHKDAWLRMRAIDSLEKVCRERPEWLKPYIERLLNEVAKIDQASIQWHLAEIFVTVELTDDQRKRAINLMKRNIASNEADWIVASNTMTALTKFVESGYLSANELMPLLKVQQHHRSQAVVRRAEKLIATLN